MKKYLIILCFVAVFGLTATVRAQSKEIVSKPRMLIEQFEYSSKAAHMSDLFRNSVIGALEKTQRFELLDAKSREFLAQEMENRADEGAIGDATARTEIVTNRANHYILRGSLIECSSHSMISDGKMRYTYKIEYRITITDVAKSTDITRTFSHGTDSQSLKGDLGALLTQLSSYSSSENAIRQGLSRIEADIKNMLITDLPLKGEIIGLDYIAHKGKLKECYINIGSDLGVKPGDYFVIKAIQYRAGRPIAQDIGTLKVKEVFTDDPGLAYCTVTKGEKAVYEAMEEYQNYLADDPNAQPLIVVSTSAPTISF